MFFITIKQTITQGFGGVATKHLYYLLIVTMTIKTFGMVLFTISAIFVPAIFIFGFLLMGRKFLFIIFSIHNFLSPLQTILS